MQEAARAVGRQLQAVTAATEAELEPAFASVQGHAGALVVPPDPFFTGRDQLVVLAARRAIPTSYPFREYAAAGGLMSYGTNLVEALQTLTSFGAGRLAASAHRG
jgi:putative tryptophan/tyrosine transport system substrate-binding protein